MTAASRETTTTTSDLDLVIQRQLNAPRELVYKAWTEPERLMQWWVAPGVEAPAFAIDLRVDGSWRAAVELLELLEQATDVLGGDALPVIGHPDLDLATGVARPDLHPVALGGELDGVGEQVRHDLDHAVEIHPHLGGVPGDL